MHTKMIEATNGPRNWGKFMVGWMSREEWEHDSQVDGRPLLLGGGWTKDHVWVLDLQTGEGGMFLLGGLASPDLSQTRLRVSPCLNRSWSGCTRNTAATWPRCRRW